MSPRKKTKPNRAWQDVAHTAQQIRDKSLVEVDGPLVPLQNMPKNVMEIPKQLLLDSDFHITSLSIDEMLQLMSTGSLSAGNVARAFLRRAVLAQQLTNCVVELLPSRAQARAEVLDAFVKENDRSKGILHGLPVSIKAHIEITGCHTPGGYLARFDHIAPRDALVVQILERAGAVVYARTTEPQSVMHLECASNLYGVTVNPHNTALTSGGSSGGEGALIALRGSLLGVGSDVGGSIRVPAAFCGIYGLKPSGFRVPTIGYSSVPPGCDPIPTVLGPMSASLGGIELFMKAILAAEPWRDEPALIPLPWRDVQIRPSQDKPLRIGIMWHDGVVLPHPPVTRALREVARRIAGVPDVEVVDFAPYKHDEGWAIVSSLYFTDGGEADAAAIAEPGEPWLPLTEWIVRQNACVQELDRKALEFWQEEREAFRLEYSQEWNRTGSSDEETGRWEGAVDAVICPVSPGAATRLNTAKYWYYTAIWNLLDYPALAFPVGRADQGLDMKSERAEFMSGLDEENWALYDAPTFDGMPLGLQIVGRRFEDEKIVAILKFLQDKVSDWPL